MKEAAIQTSTKRNPSQGNSLPDAGIALCMLVAFALVPALQDKGITYLAAVTMIHVLFSLALNVVFGQTGMVSFGHAAYFAAGAYTTGFLLQQFSGLSFAPAWIASGIIGACLAAAVGVVALRRASGIHFAILTLALAELLHVLISKSSFLGRDDGLTGIRRPVFDLGFVSVDLASGNHLYYATLFISIALTALLWVFWHNRLGRLLAALRQDELRVRFFGANVNGLRMVALVISGAVSGLAGGLYAPTAQMLTPELAHWSYSALPILMCLVGGTSSFWGPAVGAILFLSIEHLTRNVIGLSEMIIGLTLLGVVLAFPGGLLGRLKASGGSHG
ncbi:branched-chain amino acid ABC transporter permease [Cupriavidus numazuensis]|uniref:Branched-chain amino acid ABC transporter permease n=1 Tax=Cupriavidus numazuensis TaxID=221992 RepID=A0ABM8TV09_9BURK|nr:branched-chain amino acid ABC transporter permease [Cupriavidus numazuensis]CAG2160369.1 hypothetical protein LMG26411_07435 [Cupriavidus numazuensis]